MSRFTGAVFDLDGTLLDSMRLWSEIDVDFLKRRGIDVPTDYQKEISMLSPYDAAIYTVRRFRLDDTPEGLVREWTEMAAEAYAHHIPCKPGALEYVDLLIDSGLRIAAATSSERVVFESALERTGLADRISAVVTVSDVGSDKRTPEVYLEAARRIGAEPGECMVFEDMLQGLRSARSGGFYTVGVYDPASEDDQQALRREADLYIRSFSELLDRTDHLRDLSRAR